MTRRLFESGLGLAAVAVLAACASSVRTNVVAEAPPVPQEREIRFHEGVVACETRKVGDLRLPVSEWPSVRPEAEQKVRAMGGEAVVRWSQRTVMVGGRDSGVPGGVGGPRERRFWFGVVVRFPGDCPAA